MKIRFFSFFSVPELMPAHSNFHNVESLLRSRPFLHEKFSFLGITVVQ